MNIGPALKYLRNKKGLTLDEVANSLNKRVAKEDVEDIKFNKGKISKWENGKEEPKISALKYVADFYNITIDEMISFSINVAENKDLEIYNNLIESFQDLGLKVFVDENDNEFNICVSNGDSKINMSYSEFVMDPILTYEYITRELIKSEKHQIPLIGQIACGLPILAEENIEDYFTIDDRIHADFCLRAKGDSMIDEGINDGDIVFIKKQNTLENGEIGAVVIENEATLKRFYKSNNRLILQPANANYEPIILESGEIHIAGKLVAILNIRS